MTPNTAWEAMTDANQAMLTAQAEHGVESIDARRARHRLAICRETFDDALHSAAGRVKGSTE